MDDDQREAYEERAAIMEYDGGLSCREAENLAAAFTRRSAVTAPREQQALPKPTTGKKKVDQKTKDEISKVKRLLNDK